MAGTVELFKGLELCIRGVCPRCSGSVDSSLHICEDHEPKPDEVCQRCGTRDEVRVRYVCSVCKHRETYPVVAAVHGHPAVVAFCYEHDIERTVDLDNPAAYGQVWARLHKEHTLLSADPVRIRVSMPAEEETLHLYLDEDLAVTDVTRSNT